MTTTCIWDEEPAVLEIEGTGFCTAHGQCGACTKPVDPATYHTCTCDKWGYAGHEDVLYCSEGCLFDDHPEPCYDQEEADAEC